VIGCTSRIAAIIAVRVADHRGEKADARGAIHGALMRVQYVESKTSGLILVAGSAALERAISQELRVDEIQQRRPRPQSAHES
jgi:hypothetical protein